MLSQSPFLYLIGFILYATKIPPSVIASRFCDSADSLFLRLHYNMGVQKKQ